MNILILGDIVGPSGRKALTKKLPHLIKKKRPSWYYEFQVLGYNYRLNEMQSALGISQLKRLNKWVSYRNQIANIYRKELCPLMLI